MPYISGKSGSVQINGSSYPFRKWTVSIEGSLPKVTNFTSPGGKQELIDAIAGATVTVEGPVNGAYQFNVFDFFTWELHYTNAIVLTVPGYIQKIEPDDDIENFPIVKITILSSGDFDASIFDD